MTSPVAAPEENNKINGIALVAMPLLVAFAGALIGVGLLFAASRAVHFDFRASLKTSYVNNILALLTYGAIAVPLLQWFIKKRIAFAAGFTHPKLAIAIGAVVAGICLGLMQLAVRRLLPLPFHPAYDGNPWHLILAFAASGLAAPFVEECYFRGALLGWLCRRMNGNGAIFVSALLFAGLHILNVIAGPGVVVLLMFTFVTGVANAYLALRTKSLWPGIILHSAFNITAVIYLFLSVSALTHSVSDGMVAFRAKDYDRAVAIWRALADRGNSSAQSSLGGMYILGRGVPRDPVAGVKWFALAAKSGNAVAEQNLAQAYAHGLGVPVDHAKAAKLFADSARKGLVISQIQMGFTYEHGLGMPQDPVRAYVWYRLAGPKAYDWALKDASALEKKFTTDQAREAAEALAKCRADLKTCN